MLRESAAVDSNLHNGDYQMTQATLAIFEGRHEDAIPDADQRDQYETCDQCANNSAKRIYSVCVSDRASGAVGRN